MLIEILDKGFVELQNVMGNDLAIVNAARISYLGESKGPEKDKKLLFYLMRNGHTSPFEMVEFKFHIKAPLFVARQWMRHRTWSYNEISRRYTSRNIEFYIPAKWRIQSNVNKQASLHDDSIDFYDQLNDFSMQALEHHNAALEAGVAREQARLFLPVNMYTEFIAKVDAHNLMGFLKSRMSSHAQYEIQLYAKAIFENFFKESLPWCYEIFSELNNVD